jgi:hypothetical protein
MQASPPPVRAESQFTVRRARTAGKVLSGLCVLVWAVYLVQPPLVATTGLDQSWRIGLTLAVRHHLQFGRDILFTFGPLGYVLQGMPDRTLAASSAAISLAVALIVAWGVWIALQGRSGLLQKAALVAGLLTLTTFVSLDYAAVFGAVAILARASRFPRLAVWTGAAIGLLALFGALSKYTLALDVLGAAAVVWAVDLVTGPARRRRAALVSAAVAIAVDALGLAVALHASLGGVVAYLRGAAAISAGYSAAMAVTGSRLSLGLAGVVALAVVAIGVAARRERQPTLIALAAVTLFLAWKHGFVRQDGHIVMYFATAAALAVILTAVVRRRDSAIIGLGAAVLTFAVFGFEFSRVYDVPPTLFSLERFTAAAAYLTAPLRTQAMLADEEPAALSEDRLPPALRATLGDATVDVHQTETAIVAANDLRWDPLPVFQDYTAYTPSLDAMNDAALRSHGAMWILYDDDAIDGRLPLGEMPATTDDIACLYRPYTTAPTPLGQRAFLLLHRISGGGCVVQPGAVDTSVAIGRPIDVPTPRSPAAFVTASFDLHPTLRTQVMTLLWRGPIVELAVAYVDGSQGRFRLVADTVRDGVIVSCAPRDLSDVAAFFAGARQPAAVRSVTVLAPPGAYVLRGVTFTQLTRRF